jgi:hypothetical protein
MPDSAILRQAQADALLFDQLSQHQQTNLLREVQYLAHLQAMYKFDDQIQKGVDQGNGHQQQAVDG